MMNASLKKAYFRVLKSHVLDQKKTSSEAISDLGRKLIAANVSVDDVWKLHESALGQLSRERPETALSDTFERINVPLKEVLAVYGLYSGVAFEPKEREILRRWSYLFEHADWGVAICDLSGRRVDVVNPAYAAMHGYSVNDLLSRPLEYVYPPESRPALENHMRKAVEEGHHVFESIHIRGNGEQFPVMVDLTTVRDRDGAALYLAAFVQDITKRRERETALNRQKEHFLAIFANFPEILYVLDPQIYEVLFVNRAFADLLGENPVGKICYRVFQGKEAPCDFSTNDIILTQRDTPYIWEHHNPVLNKDFLITDQIIRWPDGRDVRFELAVDITKRKQAEEKLKDALIELERSNQELEQFAYVASHDLQEPLRKIRSFTELFAKRYQENVDEKAERFIAYIVDGADRMQGLINDLLAYSRITTHAKPLELVDASTLVDQALDNLSLMIKETGAVITRDPLPMIWCEPSQFVRLFQNLMTNAIKFRGKEMPRVHISGEEQKAGSAKGKESGSEVVFGIRDNGIGIEKEYQERIFGVFQRLHTREEYPGSGIGLAICKKIVERHGGRIWVESEPGKGATFWFTLPATNSGVHGSTVHGSGLKGRELGRIEVRNR